jgi:hypothetical protein
MMRAGGWRSVALLLLILLGNAVYVVPVEVQGQTFIENDIIKDTVFTREGSPYIIARSIAIRKGVTLEVRPGTEVRIVDDAVLTVDGRLLALGRSGEVIILKGQGVKRNWRINVGQSGELHFKHVHVPEHLRLRLSRNVSVQLDNSEVNGDITIMEVNGDAGIYKSRVNFNSVKGNVAIRSDRPPAIVGSNVNFTSVSGNIIITSLSTDSISDSRVSFTSINGAITVGSIAASNVSFTSINGAITVVLGVRMSTLPRSAET